jgi:hypothetical protein
MSDSVNDNRDDYIPALLTCTIEDFNKYIGDRIKNRIPYLTESERGQLRKVCPQMR